MSPLVPTDTEIDRETLLDVSVNLIPMAILAFFIALFFVYSPYPPNLFAFAMAHILTIVPFVLLGLLTYVSAKVIARDEEKLEERSGAVADTPAGTTESVESDPDRASEASTGASASTTESPPDATESDGTEPAIEPATGGSADAGGGSSGSGERGGDDAADGTDDRGG